MTKDEMIQSVSETGKGSKELMQKYHPVPDMNVTLPGTHAGGAVHTSPSGGPTPGG